MIDFIKTIFGSTNNIAVFISALSALIAAISTVIAFVSNRRSQKHYKESIKPQLSMKLVDFNGFLYLQVKNTGKTVAREISIKPLEIKNNGDNDHNPNTGGLFSMKFELYPEETVQSEVGTCFKTICNSPFPQLFLSVKYSIDGIKKQVEYTRTVTYAPAYDNKIIAYVSLDKQEIEKTLKSISRSAVRTANYLDGCQVAEFDELNILAKQSLRNDLLNALGKKEEEVLSRTETIKKAFRNGDENNDEVSNNHHNY